jgi:hypothetical protein
MTWHVARMGRQFTHKTVGKPPGKVHLQDQKDDGRNNITMDFRNIGYGNWRCMELTEDHAQHGSLVIAGLKFRDPPLHC